jgi:predicted RNA binding protein YcfA (HicA-like mRNA interferase family)
VSRLFIYGHEGFHHVVESFATRLEISHREPLYRRGFDKFYQKYLGTRDSIEEALASAYGYRKVQDHAFRRPNEKDKREVGLATLAEYIRQCPPGYDRALEFVQSARFIAKRSEFAEANHNYALPRIPRLGSRTWDSFGHAFSGISRVHSRVNYAIRRESSLGTRVRTRGYHLRYREVEERLHKFASCTVVRQKGGHEIWQNPDGHRLPVPRHPGDLRIGTLQNIIRQAGLEMSVSEFMSRKF